MKLYKFEKNIIGQIIKKMYIIGHYYWAWKEFIGNRCKISEKREVLHKIKMRKILITNGKFTIKNKNRGQI